MILFLFQWYRQIALVAVLAGIYAYHWNAVRQAKNEGYALAIEEARIAAGKRIVDMEKANETFRNLPARDRCLAFMRDSGLSAKHCD